MTETAFSTDRLLKLATSRMFSAMTAFFTWKWLHESINSNTDGFDKAQENVDEVVNKYPAVFHQMMVNSYKCFILDLSVFFDKEYDKTFSLKKIIDSLRSKLDKETFDKIEDIKKRNGSMINLILELRSQDVAHQAINSEKQLIFFDKFESFFKDIQEILNLLSSNHDRSEHWWDHVEENVRRDMAWVFENLKRGEKQRIKEIEDEYADLD